MTNTAYDPDTLTENVLSVYRSASAEQIATGLEWYAEAYRVATDLAERYGVTVDIAAGVIAAVSPLNSWGANVRLAERIIAAGGLDKGYLSVGLAKARAILGGLDIRAVLKSDKVVNFYECIRTSGATDAVCVDRHAFDIAVDTRHADSNRPKLAGKRYAEIADAYRRAGAVVNVSPAVLQAITWVTWRNRFWSEGAFDLRETA